MSTKDDALIEKMAKAVHKRQLERTGAGRAFDEALPPTDGELDNARAALAVARKAILEEAAKVAETGIVHDHLVYGTTVSSKTAQQIAAELRSLANQEQHNEH